MHTNTQTHQRRSLVALPCVSALKPVQGTVRYSATHIHASYYTAVLVGGGHLIASHRISAHTFQLPSPYLSTSPLSISLPSLSPFTAGPRIGRPEAS